MLPTGRLEECETGNGETNYEAVASVTTTKAVVVRVEIHGFI